MSACADPQPHAPVVYKDCADLSEMPEVVRAREDPAELVAIVGCSRVQGVSGF